MPLEILLALAAAFPNSETLISLSSIAFAVIVLGAGPALPAVRKIVKSLQPLLVFLKKDVFSIRDTLKSLQPLLVFLKEDLPDIRDTLKSLQSLLVFLKEDLPAIRETLKSLQLLLVLALIIPGPSLQPTLSHRKPNPERSNSSQQQTKAAKKPRTRPDN